MKIEYIIGILIIWGLVSCSDRDENQEPTYGKVNVALSVTLPEPENVHSLARSYTDCEIKNVDVLVRWLIKVNSVCMPLRYLWVFVAYIALKRAGDRFPAAYRFVRGRGLGIFFGVWCFVFTAFACITGIAAPMLVTYAAEQLDEYFTYNNTVGSKADHFKGIGRCIARKANASARPQGNLPLKPLGHSRLIAIAQLGHYGVARVLQRHLIGRTRSALDTVNKKTAANSVRVAQQVVIDRNGCGGSRALDRHRHTKAKSRVKRKVHLLHRFFNGVKPLMIGRRMKRSSGYTAYGLNVRRYLGRR